MYEQVISQLFNFEKVSINSMGKKRKAFANSNGKLQGVVQGTFPNLDILKNEQKPTAITVKQKTCKKKNLKFLKKQKKAI